MSEPVHKPRAREADVGLLLEGTYPYVAGGVSSWVHQIINGFPDITFAICFLGSRRQDYSDMKFKLPPNVVHIEEHYLYEPDGTPPVTPQRGNPQMSALTRELHDYFREPQRLAQRGGEVLEQVSNELHGRMDLRHGPVDRRYPGQSSHRQALTACGQAAQQRLGHHRVADPLRRDDQGLSARRRNARPL